MTGRETPEYRTYAVEPIDDELGQGVRLYDSFDNVYEARDHGAFGSRIYTDGDAWELKLRVPGDPDEVVEYLEGFGEAIEAEYGREFFPELSRIPDEAEDGLVMTRHAADIEIGYTTREVDMEAIEADVPRPDGDSMMLYWAGYAAGFTAGNTVLPGVGPFVAGVTAGIGSEVAIKGGSFLTEHAINRRRRSSYRDIDILDDPEHFSDVSELNRLDNLDWDFDHDLSDREEQRLQELREDDIEAKHELRMETHFHSFTDHEGGYVEAVRPEYGEATEILGTVLDTETGSMDRPSIYTEAAAFETVFEELEGQSRMALARNVIDGETAEAVDAYLDEQHPDVIKQAGETSVFEGA